MSFLATGAEIQAEYKPNVVDKVLWIKCCGQIFGGDRLDGPEVSMKRSTKDPAFLRLPAIPSIDYDHLSSTIF